MRNKFLLLLLFSFTLSSFGQQISFSYHSMFQQSLWPFYHGVAAGDSRSNGFVIWTRITPKRQVGVVEVKWFVAKQDGKIVKQGKALALAEKDYTVKVRVRDLEPWTQYLYWFEAYGRKSDVGKIKTAPAGGQEISKLSFVVFTGSNYNAGFFNAYCDAAKQPVDFAIHTGDYIYEYKEGGYGNNPQRKLAPKHETVTLNDYRTRYSHYRLDTCLRKAHEAFGWYTIWDDHEVANDTWKEGAQNHQPETEGDFFERKTNALTAYYEWMPIEENIDTSVNRVVNFGTMATVIFIDTRQHGRDFQKLNPDDTNKTMLGKDQLNWLFSELLKAKESGVDWIVVSQQLMMAPLVLNGRVVNQDGWDMYRHERRKILQFIYEHKLDNVVFIGGDFHTSWINGLYLNPMQYRGKRKSTRVSVEFVTPSVTSASATWAKTQFGKFLSLTRKYSYIKYVDLHHKGYMILNFYPQKVEVEYRYVKTIDKPSKKARTHKRFVYTKEMK